MNQPLLGNGGIIDGEYAEVGEVEQLRADNERLETENRRLRQDFMREKLQREAAVAAITALQKQLGPLHRALRGVFGEITMVIGEDGPAPTGAATAPSFNSHTAHLDKWDAIKQRLGNGSNEARLIDTLLECGPRTNTQLKGLMRLSYETVRKLTIKVDNLGFITKQGDAWALRP